ncbi:MAG TPA: DUF222 domain-containing protein [Ilumatobacter sp.]|nr:DUF222 domain-containing protein [Ilumatobacter sp.]
MFGELVEERMGWTATQLDAELREIELAHRALEARRAANLTAAEARQVRDLDGHRTTQAYVRATTNQPAALASVQVRRARFCRDHPAAGDALLAGYVGLGQVDDLARLAKHPRVGVLVDGPVLASFLDDAEHSSYRELKSLVDQFIETLDQEGAWRDHLDDVERRTAFVKNVSGSLFATAEGGDVLTAERLEKIMDRFREAEFERDVAARRAAHGDDAEAHPLPRTDRQRRFDALVAIFDTANANAAAPGKPVDVCANVMVGQRALHDALAQAGLMLPNGNVWDPDDPDFHDRQREALIAEFVADPSSFLERRCQTESGQPVHPRLLVQALIGGYVRRVVVDSAGEVVEVGSKERLFRGKYAVAARIAHATCEHPGCELPAHLCDVDHRVPHSSGGPTAPNNSAIECNTHNRLKHSRRWRTVRARNRRLITIRDDGTLMLPAGERPPPLNLPRTIQWINLRRDDILSGRVSLDAA